MLCWLAVPYLPGMRSRFSNSLSCCLSSQTYKKLFAELVQSEQILLQTLGMSLVVAHLFAVVV